MVLHLKCHYMKQWPSAIIAEITQLWHKYIHIYYIYIYIYTYVMVCYVINSEDVYWNTSWWYICINHHNNYGNATHFRTEHTRGNYKLRLKYVSQLQCLRNTKNIALFMKQQYTLYALVSAPTVSCYNFTLYPQICMTNGSQQPRRQKNNYQNSELFF